MDFTTAHVIVRTKSQHDDGPCVLISVAAFRFESSDGHLIGHLTTVHTYSVCPPHTHTHTQKVIHQPTDLIGSPLFILQPSHSLFLPSELCLPASFPPFLHAVNYSYYGVSPPSM